MIYAENPKIKAAQDAPWNANVGSPGTRSYLTTSSFSLILNESWLSNNIPTSKFTSKTGLVSPFTLSFL